VNRERRKEMLLLILPITHWLVFDDIVEGTYLHECLGFVHGRNFFISQVVDPIFKLPSLLSTHSFLKVNIEFRLKKESR